MSPAPQRIFVAHDLSELALSNRSQVCRYTKLSPRWACEPFNPSHQALVRDAWTRTVRIEAKLRVP